MKTQFSSAVFLALLATGVCFSSASAQSSLPQFKDYPATLYKGPNAPVVLTRNDLNFKTRLREAAKTQKPNFAGHYILTTWGCGTECLMGAIIDARTGKVYWWDFSLCCWGFDNDENFKPIEFRLSSRLIVFSGMRNERDGDNAAHFYHFDGRKFVHIRSNPRPTQ